MSTIYLSSHELESRIGSARLQNLLRAAPGQSAALIQAMIERAQALVDGFAAARYQTPLSPTPLIAEWTFSIVEYELHRRGPAAAVPDKVRLAYENCLAQLSALADGKLQTGGLLSPQKNSARQGGLHLLSAPSVCRADDLTRF